MSRYKSSDISDILPKGVSEEDFYNEKFSKLDDKKLLSDIQKMSAFHIRAILALPPSTEEERKVRDQILVKLSGMMMPKAEKDTEVTEEDTSLTEDELSALDLILNASENNSDD